MLVGDALELDLPESYFDAIWVSNFLEHLHSQEEVAHFLERMLARLAPGGRIAIMGPNFRYCAKEYFDMADHTVILTHAGVERAPLRGRLRHRERRRRSSCPTRSPAGSRRTPC